VKNARENTGDKIWRKEKMKWVSAIQHISLLLTY